MKISIVIPAHNEEKRITRTLEKYCGFLKEKNLNMGQKEFDNFEILVVINNTHDRTEEIVKKYQKKFKEIRYLKFEQGGKGFAVIEGFKDALTRENDLIGFIDADMSTPPEAFYDLVETLKEKSSLEGVIANRWDKKSKINPKQSLLRRILSRGFNLFVRGLFLFNHRDTQCGAKLFRRELLKKIIHKLGSSEWSFDVDLLFYMRREKAKIKSIPTIWCDEVGSNINLKKTPLTMFLSVIRLRLVHSPFDFIVRFYRKLPDSLKIHKIV